jgi:uncharacterized protein
MEIHRGSHDLSRRSLEIPMRGMSFRKYIELDCDIKMPVCSLKTILAEETKNFLR